SEPLPLLYALRTAVCSVVDAPPPSDSEITFEPCWASQVMQFATPDVLPEPTALSALHMPRLELNATPATPTPLLALAAIGPEPCVRWSLSSVHPPELTVPNRVDAWLQSTSLPDRSSCVLSIPVSTMPTRTPPLAGNAPSPPASQPSGASMSASLGWLNPQ